jgi:nicotinate phosphoribosyltransferase
VNEVYFMGECDSYKMATEIGETNLRHKINQIKGTGIKFADFGTRRAFCRNWHEFVIQKLIESGIDEFIGTSNVLYSMKYGIKAIGTMAHEVFQVCQALTRLEDSQQFALQKWADEYRGELGIALTDTLGIDKFIKDFDRYFALLFDGVRQDSGSPELWFDKMLKHYMDMGINTLTKTAIFSDGLTFDRMLEIDKYVDARMNTAYGIGTNLTNDVGYEPLQIVMKVVEANRQPVAKLSDSKGKEMCEDEDYVSYLRKVIK